MIVGEEVLEAAGPVGATGQETKHALLAAHVAVPRVLFDGRVGRPLTHEEVDTLHAKTPTQQRETETPPVLVQALDRTRERRQARQEEAN